MRMLSFYALASFPSLYNPSSPLFGYLMLPHDKMNLFFQKLFGIHEEGFCRPLSTATNVSDQVCIHSAVRSFEVFLIARFFSDCDVAPCLHAPLFAFVLSFGSLCPAASLEMVDISRGFESLIGAENVLW